LKNLKKIPKRTEYDEFGNLIDSYKRGILALKES
jgi:hypothetical protein